MSQIIDILLEKPDKVERALLLLMKSLVTIWGLNYTILLFDESFLSSMAYTTSLDFLNEFSPFKSALYLLGLIFMWIILWEVIANWLLPLLCKLFIVLLRFVTYYPVDLILWIAKFFKRSPLLSESNTPEDKLSNSEKIMKALNDKNKMKFYFGSLSVFHVVNSITNSSAGSQVLYMIISHEKTAFVKSRIQAYYALLIFLFIGIGLVYGINLIFIIFSIVLILPTIVLALMKDVFDDLESHNLVELQLKLPNDIYIDMVDKTFRDHELTKNFTHESLTKRLVLTKKLNSIDKKINVLRFKTGEEYMSLTPHLFIPLKKDTKLSGNSKFIFVSDMIPDIGFRNLLAEKGFFYIYAKNEEDLFVGLNKISPLIKQWLD